MIRLVLFDIDGTLIHTGGAGVKAFDHAFWTEFQLPGAADRLSFAGRTDTGLAREFFRMNGRDPSEADLRRFYGRYLLTLEQFLERAEGGIFPGVETWLKELRSLPAPPAVGLLTGNLRAGAELKLRRYRLWEHFALGGFADDHENRDHIAHAARDRGSRHLRRELLGEEILVIGDTPLDIQCARAIGARALAVATGSSTTDKLMEHKPDWAVKTLADLSARDVCA